jgi:hypothetical protein
MNKGKVLSVGNIYKTKTSYGDYCFNVVILEKGINGLYKSEKSIYKYGLKNIKLKQREYLNKLNKLLIKEFKEDLK